MDAQYKQIEPNNNIAAQRIICYHAHSRGLADPMGNKRVIIGTGMDIVEIARVKGACDQYGDRFLARVFAEEEVRYSFRRSNPHPSLAVRFAAKEALSKALRVGRLNPFEWSDACVEVSKEGLPYFRFSSRLREHLGESRVHLSLSHTEKYASAMVVIEGSVS